MPLMAAAVDDRGLCRMDRNWLARGLDNPGRPVGATPSRTRGSYRSNGGQKASFHPAWRTLRRNVRRHRQQSCRSSTIRPDVVVRMRLRLPVIATVGKNCRVVSRRGDPIPPEKFTTPPAASLSRNTIIPTLDTPKTNVHLGR